MAMVTAIWAAAGTGTITAGAAVADIIMAGATIAKQRFRSEFALAISLPGRGQIPDEDRSRAARPVNFLVSRWSAQPHLDRDPYKIRMIFGPELLLEQRGCVGDRLVGDAQGVGDFDDLVAAA
jgi:hypothetical protein